MTTVNMHEAKTHLSRLVEQAARGETVVIAKAGKPLVKLVPVDIPARPCRIGFMKGEITVPDDFDTMGQDEIERMFYGELSCSSTPVYCSGLPPTSHGSARPPGRVWRIRRRSRSSASSAFGKWPSRRNSTATTSPCIHIASAPRCLIGAISNYRSPLSMGSP